LNINKNQVADLLESLADFDAVPRSGLDLAATLAANAQRAQLEAQRRFGLSLSSDIQGIRALSQLLSAMHEAVKPGRMASLLGSKIPFQSAVLIANTFGAFLGETMRKGHGGEWRPTNLENETFVALHFDERNWCLPMQKAGKHFLNGAEDDVMFFYQVFVERRSPSSLQNALVITAADVAQGQEHIMDMLARHNASKSNVSEH
jgi:hypothetical protein